MQNELENEKIEVKFLLSEKEKLQIELRRALEEAEARARATPAIPPPPAAPVPPHAPKSQTALEHNSSGDVGGLLAAITKGTVSLQPVVQVTTTKVVAKMKG